MLAIFLEMVLVDLAVDAERLAHLFLGLEHEELVHDSHQCLHDCDV